MAWKRVPVETWEEILRYAIHVPTFFDPNPVENYGPELYARYFQKEDTYWEVERYRNALRRVCSAWNVYLKKFDHRYVTFYDVSLGLVPVSAVTQAIRLKLNSNQRYHQIEKSILTEAIAIPVTEWPLEIISSLNSDSARFIIQSGRAGRLKSFAYTEDSDLEELASLPLLHCKINWLASDLDRSKRSLCFSRLISLSILDDLDSLFGCQFPALKHLRINSCGSELSPDDVLEFLRSSGRNLVTFLDRSDFFSDCFLPEEIWKVCPKLERFQTSFQWPSAMQIPLPASLRRLYFHEDLIGVFEQD